MRRVIQWVSFFGTLTGAWVIAESTAVEINMNTFVFFGGSVLVLCCTVLAGGRDD